MGAAAAPVLPAQLPGRAAGLQLPQPRRAGLAAGDHAVLAGRGVDGFRLDTVNFYFHDKLLRDDPADYRRKAEPEWNPYAMQYHIFSKNQPENLAFLERMRELLDEYEARAMVGEMGESHHAIRMMGEYTTGRRLHKCYSFEMLDYDFTAGAFPQADRGVLRRRAGRLAELGVLEPRRGAPCHPLAQAGASPEALAKLAGALLLSLEGSICLYQGEELGQTETELEYHELTDPQGIRFWPENKGRDGCRTPMVWDAAEPNAGFSTGRPWLPVKAPQAARPAAGQVGEPDSVLEFYRRMLRLRRETDALRMGRTKFFDVSEPVLAFTRATSCSASSIFRRRRIRCGGGRGRSGAFRGGGAQGRGAEAAPQRLRDHGSGRRGGGVGFAGEARLSALGASRDACAETYMVDMNEYPEFGNRIVTIVNDIGPQRQPTQYADQRIGRPFASKRCRFSSSGRMPIFAPHGIEVLPSWRTSTGSSEPISTKR